jgi:serine/threonine-protein kinase
LVSLGVSPYSRDRASKGTATQDKAPPLLANRYRLRRVLARGGMGVVFLALDTRHGSRVAVKLLKPTAVGRDIDRARFKREAETASELRHPNLVAILDHGEDESGAPYLVSELMEGRSLDEELRSRRKLPVEETLAYLLPVTGGLAHAHDRGVIHRDVKPGNIFLCRGESGERSAKLLDFGVATSIDATRLTASNVAVGTLHYMAPEQITGIEVGPAIDVWAMGAVLYRCLSGTVPYARKNVSEQLRCITRDPVRPLSESLPGIDAGFCATVERALQQNLQRRYGDMRTMARALLIAAVASGIALPGDPDPVGLPDWRSWYTTALQEGDETVKG